MINDVLNNVQPWHIEQGDVLEVLRKMPDEVIHCVVTSPPYWSLRDYGMKGQLGLEKTPELYVEKMVEIFREIKRVLRSDGTLWLNLGDSYASAGNGGHSRGSDLFHGHLKDRGDLAGQAKKPPAGLKPKDLVGIPWRVAFALQADGWYLRRDIIWEKPTAMPESVTDRPTTSHEYVFLLTKSPRYFYDKIASMEPVTGNAHARGNGVNPKAKAAGRNSRTYQDRDPNHPTARKSRQNESFSAAISGPTVHLRNRRSVWRIQSKPCREAHFATFPPNLVHTCLVAGTSSGGCCPTCWAPWKRQTKKVFAGDWHPDQDQKKLGINKNKTKAKFATLHDREKGSRMLENTALARLNGGEHDNPFPVPETTGWVPSCDYYAGYSVPCIVLDPFSGAGTTGLVARMLGINFIGIELKPEYCEMARRRITDDAPLFNSPGTKEKP